MRLSETEHQAIIHAIGAVDSQARIYLFGSRAKDDAKGGDIDLLVLSRKIDLWARLDILADLHQVLGEQKIDLIVCPDLSRPFTRLAISEGVPL